MKLEYKRNILVLSLLLSLQNVFAQCTEQKNFDINWNISRYNIAYDIKRKDGNDFSYYNPGKSFNQIYKGIKLDESINIPVLNYAIFRAYPSVDFDRMEKLLKGNNNQLSSYVNSYASSKTYEFPFEKSMFVSTKRMIDKFNLEEKMGSFTRNNPVYGTHKIKYYIILFHDEYGRKCSYFESPEIKYNFGTKPFSLVWKDLWGEEDSY